MPEINLTPLVDFAGAALGALMALLLATGTRGNRDANRWLAAYSGCLALLSLGDFAEDSRLVLARPHLAHLTDWLIFLVGPCSWMYVRRLAMQAEPSFRRWLWHCLPAALCLLLLVPFYALPADEKLAAVAAELADGSRLELPLAIAATQVLAYWVASLVALRRYDVLLRGQFSSLEKRKLSWFKWMLGINFAMWVLWMVGLTLETSWAIWLDRLAIPLGFYVLAFLGIRQPAIFAGRSAATGAPALPEVPPAGSAARPPARYQRSGLSKESVPALLARLEELVRAEKPWLENDLTLAQLAERLGLSTHHVSQLLNEELGTTFFDYVNAQRVREVQRCLVDPMYGSQTILAIALSAGFNSKAAFNAAFRQHTGMTPSAYRLKGRAD